MRRGFLGEQVPSAVFAHWRKHPLYILLVFLLGQALITAPVFVVSSVLSTLITLVPVRAYILPVIVGQAFLILVGGWLYYVFSPHIRRFLSDLIAGEPLGAKQATAAWLEAVAFPQRVIAGVTVAIVVTYSLQALFFGPRFGWLAALEGSAMAVTMAFWAAMFFFLSYLEAAMQPVIRMALAMGAEPALDELGLARLRLGTKLHARTLSLIVVPATLLGLFAYSQVIALGGDPARMLWLTVLIVTAAGAATLLQAFLLVRSIMAPVRELQRVIDEIEDGNLDVSTRILTTDEMADLGLQFNLMVERLRQNEELGAAFGRYVSPAVRDGILHGTIALGGERREVTILFSDIRGFTGWCEREPPETVIQTLNMYYGFLVQALLKYGGTVTRYTGDGVLALFGAPLDDPDHALHAVQAAWEAKVLLEKFNDIRSTLGAFELCTGFGVHSGEAVVGSIGTEARAEYTPIGDAANVASRIEGLNKDLGTAILISGDTYLRVVDCIQVGQQAEVTVKGRSQPVRVVEVVGVR